MVSWYRNHFKIILAQNISLLVSIENGILYDTAWFFEAYHSKFFIGVKYDTTRHFQCYKTEHSTIKITGCMRVWNRKKSNSRRQHSKFLFILAMILKLGSPKILFFKVLIRFPEHIPMINPRLLQIFSRQFIFQPHSLDTFFPDTPSFFFFFLQIRCAQKLIPGAKGILQIMSNCHRPPGNTSWLIKLKFRWLITNWNKEKLWKYRTYFNKHFHYYVVLQAFIFVTHWFLLPISPLSSYLQGIKFSKIFFTFWKNPSRNCNANSRKQFRKAKLLDQRKPQYT